MEKKNVIEMYHLPGEVRYCKRCTMSNQRPRITFDGGGYVVLVDLLKKSRVE